MSGDNPNFCPRCDFHLPVARKPIEVINELETCLGFLEWLTKRPADLSAVIIGELGARELVGRYVKSKP